MNHKIVFFDPAADSDNEFEIQRKLKKPIPNKYTFSGHDSFQCRLLWLKKGYDFLKRGHLFSDADAPVLLGVGNNMVRSIRYWLRSFGLIKEDTDELTQIATLIFDMNNGFDPYLEDQATLWLLHYQLIRTRFASTYWLMFSELRKRKVEFSREDYIHLVTLRAEIEKFSANASTIGDDFTVFTKLYLQGNRQAKDKDDTAIGLLTDLNLLRTIERISKDGKSTSLLYTIPLTEREDLPAELILYCLLDTPNVGLSISMESLESDPGMPCSMFAMNRGGLQNKIQQLVARFPKILTFSDNAGIRELQFRKKPADPLHFLKEIYAPAEV